MKSLMSGIERGVAFCAALALAGFTLVMILDVICRYWLKIPLPWVAELAVLLFQWAAFLGAALALRRGLHFGVGLVFSISRQAVVRVSNAVVALVVIASSVFLLCTAWQLTVQTWPSRYATLPLSHGVAYAGLMLGSALMAIFGAERGVVAL